MTLADALDHVRGDLMAKVERALELAGRALGRKYGGVSEQLVEDALIELFPCTGLTREECEELSPREQGLVPVRGSIERCGGDRLAAWLMASYGIEVDASTVPEATRAGQLTRLMASTHPMTPAAPGTATRAEMNVLARSA